MYRLPVGPEGIATSAPMGPPRDDIRFMALFLLYGGFCRGIIYRILEWQVIGMQDVIHIKGARENNLKDVELIIPRDKLVVFTGLSGSGKSSLAFDTIYAE